MVDCGTETAPNIPKLQTMYEDSLPQEAPMLSTSRQPIPDDTPDSLVPVSGSAGVGLAADDGKASSETPDEQSNRIANTTRNTGRACIQRHHSDRASPEDTRSSSARQGTT
jgi:hypothetical protein